MQTCMWSLFIIRKCCVKFQLNWRNFTEQSWFQLIYFNLKDKIINIGFLFSPIFSLSGKDMQECYDAKVINHYCSLIHITKVGLLQIYPPYENLDPRFLRLREKLRIILTKTRLSFPGCFFLRMVRPLNLEELD